MEDLFQPRPSDSKCDPSINSNHAPGDESAPPQWITIAEASEQYAVSQTTLRVRIKKNLLSSLPLIKHGHTVTHVNSQEVGKQYALRLAIIGLAEQAKIEPSPPASVNRPSNADALKLTYIAALATLASGIPNELFKLFIEFLKSVLGESASKKSAEMLIEEFDERYAHDPVTAKLQMDKIALWDLNGRLGRVWGEKPADTEDDSGSARRDSDVRLVKEVLRQHERLSALGLKYNRDREKILNDLKDVNSVLSRMFVSVERRNKSIEKGNQRLRDLVTEYVRSARSMNRAMKALFEQRLDELRGKQGRRRLTAFESDVLRGLVDEEAYLNRQDEESDKMESMLKS